MCFNFCINCIPAGITSSAVGIKICVITARIKKYKSIIKKTKKKHDKIVVLGKDNLNTIEVLISKSLIDSYISLHGFVSINNVLTEQNRKTKQNRLMLLLNCAACNKKKSTFIKNKETNDFNRI